MRRSALAVLISTALLSLIAAPAGAESQTVAGTDGIKKMAVTNATKALTVKVFGLDVPCGGTQHVKIHVKWGKTAAYVVEGSCISGEFYSGLYYLADRTNPEGAKAVKCDGWKLSYNNDKKFHKTFLPRTCIGKAADRVKVNSLGYNYGAMVEGKAGPTKLLARG